MKILVVFASNLDYTFVVIVFFSQFVNFTLCDGEFSTLMSTMKLRIPIGFLKRFVLKVNKQISKANHSIEDFKVN